MYITIKRIYKNSYDEMIGRYNVLIWNKAVQKGWITEQQKNKIIKEVV